MSVRSVGLVAGPSSPARRDLRTEDSTSCGANLRFSRGGGEGVRGDGLGVSSPAGIVLRYCSNVVSIGIGANRRRGRAGEFAILEDDVGVLARRCITQGRSRNPVDQVVGGEVPLSSNVDKGEVWRFKATRTLCPMTRDCD